MSFDLSFLFFIGILLPKFNQSLSDGFFIVDLVFGTKILRGCFSLCKFFRKLLYICIKISMSKRCHVEHKGFATSCFHEQ